MGILGVPALRLFFADHEAVSRELRALQIALGPIRSVQTASSRGAAINFELPEEYQMLEDLVQRFVRDELMPLEAGVLERDATGQGGYITPEEKARLDTISKDMGLWALDAPEDAGGMGLPHVALVGVNIAMGSTVAKYNLPPDSPNLKMLAGYVNEQQRKAYLEPHVNEGTLSAIGISEPGAGADPSGMTTKAVLKGDKWIINGRKIWITSAKEADFTILLARTDPDAKGSRGMSCFLIDRDAPGFNVVKQVPMLGGEYTYEIALEDCEVEDWKLLGTEGEGFAPMQLRLGTRRMQMAAWCIGAAERALQIMTEHAPQRVTFGQPLSSRQAVQWWVADAKMKIHAARLMAYDCAWKLDEGRDVRSEISMIKVYCSEMAQEVIDNAMQCLGGMGVTKEMPLHILAGRVRNMRIYDGPSEVHRMVIARNSMDVPRG